MRNYQNYSSNAETFFNSLALVSVYNAHTFGEYDNIYTQTEKRKMYCIFLILEGSYNVEMQNGKIYTLEEDTIHFNCYQDMKRFFSNKPSCHHIAYFFYTNDFNLPLGETFKLGNLNKQLEEMETEKIIRFMQTRLPHKQKYANAYFACKLLNYLERLNSATYKSSELVDEILLYINSHIDTPLQIKQIADFFHYSEKHIHHAWHNAKTIHKRRKITKRKTLFGIHRFFLVGNFEQMRFCHPVAFNQ